MRRRQGRRELGHPLLNRTHGLANPGDRDVAEAMAEPRGRPRTQAIARSHKGSLTETRSRSLRLSSSSPVIVSIDEGSADTDALRPACGEEQVRADFGRGTSRLIRAGRAGAGRLDRGGGLATRALEGSRHLARHARVARGASLAVPGFGRMCGRRGPWCQAWRSAVRATWGRLREACRWCQVLRTERIRLEVCA